MWRNIVLHFSVLHCTIFHGIVWYYMVLSDWRDTVSGSDAMQCIELLSELAIFFFGSVANVTSTEFIRLQNEFLDSKVMRQPFFPRPGSKVN